MHPLLLNLMELNLYFLREAIQRFFLLFYGVLPKGVGVGLGQFKSFESLFFVLKQTNANVPKG